ncbi:hypothetical protein OA438_01585 [Prochlorococcus sp. AH-716-J21]|nr:hypothetical protein [Prochlorococcus sp. AH-716-J21]
MNQIILKKSLPLFIILAGFSLLHATKAGNNFNYMKSCIGYPHKNGVNFKIKPNNSFQILSTSNIEVIDNFESLALDEAEVTAYANLSDFLKLNDTSSEEDLIKELKIRKNGRLIRRKSQLKKDIDFFKFIFSNGFKGISLIDSCQKNGKSVMVTLEVTDKTYKMAEFLEKQMK